MLLLAEGCFRISVTGAHVQQLPSFAYLESETRNTLWNCTAMPAGRRDVGHFFTFPWWKGGWERGTREIMWGSQKNRGEQNYLSQVPATVLQICPCTHSRAMSCCPLATCLFSISQGDIFQPGTTEFPGMEGTRFRASCSANRPGVSRSCWLCAPGGNLDHALALD